MADVQANTITTGSLAATTLSGAVTQTRVVLPYSTSITPDASQGNIFVITVTDGVGFAINAPLNSTTGKLAVFVIRNTSGGAVGTITWNAVFKMGTFTTSATANSRSIMFHYDGTNWVETLKGVADVPN